MAKKLRILTTIYAILYVALAVSALFDEGFRRQGAGALALFVPLAVFLVGYGLVWRHEFHAGLIFILWWAGMWYVGYVLSETDRGAAVVMGFPMFVLAVLHVVSGYRGRRTTS